MKHLNGESVISKAFQYNKMNDVEHTWQANAVWSLLVVTARVLFWAGFPTKMSKKWIPNPSLRTIESLPVAGRRRDFS